MKHPLAGAFLSITIINLPQGSPVPISRVGTGKIPRYQLPPQRSFLISAGKRFWNIFFIKFLQPSIRLKKGLYEALFYYALAGSFIAFFNEVF